MTVRTSQPLSRAAVLPTFEDILRVHGAAIVKSADVYQVIPLAEAPRAGVGPLVPRRSTLQSAGYGIEVVPLKFVSAAEMEKVLGPIAPEGSILYVDAARNLLLLGGTRADLENLLSMITIFDVDLMRGMSFALIPLEHADADAVGLELQRIFSLNESANKDNADKDNKAKGSGQGSELVRFLPIPRLRSILIISPQMVYINHAREWIKTLDRRDEGGQNLHVYHVQNGRAKDIAGVLGKIFGAEESKAARTGGEIAPGYHPVAIGSGSTSGAFGEGGGGIGGGGIGGGGIANTSGKVSMAPPALTSPTKPITTESQEASVVQFSAENPVRIVADPDINALVIYASPEDYATVLSALQKIDVAPLQVMIEATIAEVTLGGSFSYGLQWFFRGIDANAETTGQRIFDVIGEGITGAASAFSYAATISDMRVTLTALSQQTDVRIISSPAPYGTRQSTGANTDRRSSSSALTASGQYDHSGRSRRQLSAIHRCRRHSRSDAPRKFERAR